MRAKEMKQCPAATLSIYPSISCKSNIDQMTISKGSSFYMVIIQQDLIPFFMPRQLNRMKDKRDCQCY